MDVKEGAGWSGVEWGGVGWSGVGWSGCGVGWSGVWWSGVEWESRGIRTTQWIIRKQIDSRWRLRRLDDHHYVMNGFTADRCGQWVVE